MSFHRWLQNLRSALAPGRGQRHRRRRGSLRAATHRPNLELLDDRLTPSFSPAVNYPVGFNPQVVATADFNNDGRLDLATANAGSNQVSVLLGNPDGTFQPALTSATGLNPEHMAVGDFNNDGYLDLATANNPGSPYGYENNIFMLMGNGDGTFQAQQVDTDGWEVLSLAAGDFNNDGHDDLVYSVFEWWDSGYSVIFVRLSNNVDWLRNEMPAATGLAVAELNGDGRLDVVGAAGGVHVFLGNGDGTLSYTHGSSEFTTGTNTQSVTVGDFTGDGIPDVAAAGFTRVAILPGDGNGNFGAPIVELTNNAEQTAVATADFNGDGKPDIVTTDLVEGNLTALLGLGGGMLSLVGDHAVGLSPRAVAVGDFNGDGRPDAVTASAGSDTVSVLLNDGAWPDVSAPRLRIADVSVREGNTGTANAVFTVTLSAASGQPVTVNYTTANSTAAAGDDYQTVSGTLTFPAGQTSGTITVPVNGDRVGESNETFLVNLSSPVNAVILDGQGLGNITDDEPRISITDVTLAEGKNGKTLFTFTVTLSVPDQPGGYDQAVTMSYRTVNGTAKSSNSDYIARTGTLTFAPGETTKSITIEVKGDSKKEANETFYLELFGNSSNSLFTKNRGIGTILNDD